MIESSRNETLGNAVLAVVYLTVGVSKLFPVLNIVSIYMVLGEVLYCAWRNQFFKLAPQFIFFNSSILYYAGTALVDVYFVAYIVIHIIKKPLVRLGSYHIVLAGFVSYCICVISAFSFSTAIAIIISFFALAILIEELSDRAIWVQFCKWYIIALFSATLYGIGNYIDGISNSLYSTFRYTATFTDPNYAGFFLSAGLYMALFLKRELGQWIRYSVICVSIISILITISSSALIANAGIIAILYFSGMGNRKVSVSTVGKVIACMPILYSCHPRSRKRLEQSGFQLDSRVIQHEPLGFHDYNCLQMNAFCVVSDSGTLPEESSFFTSVGHPFPAVCIRTSTERPEALDKGDFILAGIDERSLLQAVDTAVEMNQNGDHGIPVPDYVEENVSTKVVKIIQSYTGMVNKMVWRKG